MNPYRDKMIALSSDGRSFTIAHMTHENFNEMIQLAFNKLHVLESALENGDIVFRNSMMNPIKEMSIIFDIQTEFIEENGRFPDYNEILSIWQEKTGCVNLTQNIRMSFPLNDKPEDTHVVLETNNKYVCKECGKEYEISDDTKDWYYKKGYKLPTRCESCREKRKKYQPKNHNRKSQIEKFNNKFGFKI